MLNTLKTLVCDQFDHLILTTEQVINRSYVLFSICQVVVGDLEFPIGKLKYYKVESKTIPLMVWIGAGIGVAVVVILVICVLCWCRRSRRKQKKNFKSLEVQMNNLESKVARECREGD